MEPAMPSPDHVNGAVAVLAAIVTIVVGLGTLLGLFMRRDRDTRSDYTAMVAQLRVKHDTDVNLLRELVDSKISDVHERVNRVKEGTLQRGDLDGPIRHLEGTVNQLRAEVREDSRTARKSMGTMMGEVTKLSVAVAHISSAYNVKVEKDK